MPEGARNADVRHAVAMAREALEEDSAEARKRGWGVSAPDPASIAALAAGLLIADAINTAGQAPQRTMPARKVGTRASRTAA